MQAISQQLDLPPEWLIGEGIALTMIDTVPPAGHIADAMITLRDDGGFDLTVGTAEFGNGTSTVHQQIAATTLATTVDRIHLQPVRHRPWRPRHRRLWQRRHLRRRQGDARGGHAACDRTEGRRRSRLALRRRKLHASRAIAVVSGVRRMSIPGTGEACSPTATSH